MDTVSQAIGGLHAGLPCARRFGEAGDWGWNYDAFSGLGFHVVLRGEGWVTAPGTAPQRVSAGDVALAPHGASHAFSRRPRPLSDVPGLPTHRWAEPAPPGEVDILCGSYRLTRGVPHHFLRTLPEILVLPGAGTEKLLADLLADDIDGRGPGSDASLVALIDLIVVTVLRRWDDQESEQARFALRHPAIAAVLSMVHDDPGADWGLLRLSRAAGMSRTAFARDFKAVVGETPVAFVTGVRLGLAARALRETGAPLATIARGAGYSSEFAFASAFRRRYGVAPGRFREAGNET
ncbi:AraC family transcriptional regulator [Actinoplanes sp. NPDC049265]|uniref:AraC family transcriptional regulator n=1 Tax=Actinoplanes sp. NPDC049265 TaxID=3363902 RepID=UPI00371317A1